MQALKELIRDIDKHMRAEWYAGRLPAECWPKSLSDRLAAAVAGQILESHTAAPVAVAVPDSLRAILIDVIAQGLSGTWHCNRVWEAWNVGTMSQEDFSPADESDTPTELADAVLAAFAATPTAVAVPDALIRVAKQALACMDGLQQHLGHAVCQVEADALRAALAATPAAAPVVLPEPDFHVRPASAVQPHRALMIWDNDATSEPAYFARTVRALLATATESAASEDIARARLIAKASAKFHDDTTHLGNLVYVNDLVWALGVLSAHPAPEPADALATATGLPALTEEALAEKIRSHGVAGGALAAALIPFIAQHAPPQAQADARDALTPAARDVLAERQRQISAEGYDPDHDDEHSDGSLSIAAACYALANVSGARPGALSPSYLAAWVGWGAGWFKPSDRRRNLEKACALLLADMERIDRAAIAAEKGK